ncbi:DNA repair and recombination protein RAD54B-like isoform X1 [Schistocerca serialis cubense]|uniref:DNA repair and recombination protein RAD54B-like isoform X1 n=1 Tax=Schistocerca serialis cubense TaxID=2023355 RepID=UPI00214E0C86|nr:DNA repair and recombination protein RAD54B-like isoform X1 [Schistocerca serialis cubense]
MRRSAAPSVKYSEGGAAGNVNKADFPQASVRNLGSDFPNKSRDTDSLLDLIFAKNKAADTEQRHCDSGSGTLPEESCNVKSGVLGHVKISQEAIQGENKDAVLVNDPEKRVFNVVWAKQSTRKHKVWEGDGVLEVEGKTVILKDVGGKILCQSSNVKVSSFEDGTRLLLGGKEAEIVDEVKIIDSISVSSKRTPDRQSDQKPTKKARKDIPILHKKPSNFCGQNYRPLVMPSPPDEHRWKMNPEHLPLVEVVIDPCLAKVLRPHQRTGIIFLYECMLEMRQPNYSGAILADEMGLGKTLQCVTLVWTLLKQGPYGGRPIIRNALIVTPSSLVGNWEKEFQQWLGRGKIHTFIVNQKNKPADFKNNANANVMLISYEMFSRYYDDIEKYEFDLLICDEGHRLKNSTIKIYVMLSKLQCKRRILLTGTPVQNDLQEFYTLVNFVNPGVLGPLSDFRKIYEAPIVASRQPEAGTEIRLHGEQCAAELNHKTSWFILRRTQDLIDKILPTKHELVLFCCLSQLQISMYRAVIDYWDSRKENLISLESVPHLNIITLLKKVCNHPVLIKSSVIEEELEMKLMHMLSSEILETCPRNSGKLIIVLRLLQYLRQTKERVVFVSYYTQTLDLMAQLCENYGYKYCRLDGSTACSQRQTVVDNFNSASSKYFIFLLSARAGGIGLNLTGASRLILFDSDWNPATDLQAMSRIWRDGQLKPVFIYRLLSVGTIEEKIFQRQISKTDLSGTVVDPQNNSTIRLSKEELKDLLSYDENEICLTHKLLECTCDINGQPREQFETCRSEVDNRPSQLGSVQLNSTHPHQRMNQLLHWEHHRAPFRSGFLEGLGLLDVAGSITYIFKTSTVVD